MKKFLRIILLLIVVANSIFAAAQSPDTAKRWRWIAEPQFNYAYPFVGSLAAVKVDTLWGFIDTTGKLVSEPRFDDIGSMFGQDIPDRRRFVNHRFEKSEMYIMINLLHQDMYNDMCVRSKYLASVIQDKKIGLVDTNGRIVHEPRFEIMGNRRDCDLILAYEDYLYSDSIKGYLLDMEGRILVGPINSYFIEVDRSFISMECNGKFGVVTSKGKIIAQPIYDEIIPYDDSQVMARLDCRFVYIDQNGRVSDMATPNNLPKRVKIVQSANKYGLVGADGKVVVKPRYSKIWEVGSGVFITLNGGLFGIIDPDGVVVSEPRYKIIDECYDGNLLVTKNSKVGVIHPLKKLMFAPIFEHNVSVVGDTVAMGHIGDEIYSVDLKGKPTLLHKVQGGSDGYYSILDDIYCGDRYVISMDRIMDKDGKLLFDHPTRDGYSVRYCGNDRFMVIRRVCVRGVIDGDMVYDTMRETYGYLEIIK